MRSLDSSINVALPVALWPWVIDLASKNKEFKDLIWDIEGTELKADKMTTNCKPVVKNSGFQPEVRVHSG
jgi:hypothetical protein